MRHICKLAPAGTRDNDYYGKEFRTKNSTTTEPE